MKRRLGPKHFYVLCVGCGKRVRLDKASPQGYCPACVTEALHKWGFFKAREREVREDKKGEV